MKNLAGEFVTNLHGEMSYKSFKPAFLPLDFEFNIKSEMLSLLVEANKNIALLAAYLPILQALICLSQCTSEKRLCFHRKLKELKRLSMIS